MMAKFFAWGGWANTAAGILARDTAATTMSTYTAPRVLC